MSKPDRTQPVIRSQKTQIPNSLQVQNKPQKNKKKNPIRYPQILTLNSSKSK